MASFPRNPMEAPLLQQMTTELESISGIVIRQEAQLGEAVAQTLGVPWESKNKYKISELPAGQHALRDGKDTTGWKPTGDELSALPELMRSEEESNAFVRLLLSFLGCANMRPLKLHFSEKGRERFVMKRPFRMGGCCCCPLESTLMQGTQVIGRVEEDFNPYCTRCCQGCCCVSYTKVYRAVPNNQEEHRFTLKSALCCVGGPVNNCCGATCCNHDLLMEVLDPEGQRVATVQKTYAPTDDCSAFCRSCYMFSNYVVEFPKQAPSEDRALLTAAVLHLDYQFFEKSGNE